MSDSPCCIWWLRRDIRVDDNTCLIHLASLKLPILPLFLYCPRDEGKWAPGPASLYALKRSLHALQQWLHKRGAKLTIRCGASATEALIKIAHETRASHVFWSRCCEPAQMALEDQIQKALQKKGIIAESFQDHLLFEPWDLATKKGDPYQVFTPFYNACCKIARIPAPQTIPKNISFTSHAASQKLDEVIEDEKLAFSSPLHAPWQFDEESAQKAMGRFMQNGIGQYAAKRDFPGERGVSHLSAYLHWGLLSPRRLWHAALNAQSAIRSLSEKHSIDSYLRQLIWREFAHHLLYHFPRTDCEPLKPAFQNFPWKKSARLFSSWKEGKTGYPIVDAAMAEMTTTGWMHNRCRLITASFLVKDLLQPWIEGAKWFWQHLLDADLANNTLGWQWTAGCGADAAPYFRIFNPVEQSKRFDPEGRYITTFLPALRKLPPPWLHAPWLAPSEVLAKAGVKIGENYPHPIVEHDSARLAALEAYERIKQKSGA